MASCACRAIRERISCRQIPEYEATADGHAAVVAAAHFDPGRRVADRVQAFDRLALDADHTRGRVAFQPFCPQALPDPGYRVRITRLLREHAPICVYSAVF